MFKTSPLGIALGALMFAACSPSGQVGVEENPELGTGMLLSVSHYSETDVVGFHMQIQRIACQPGEQFEPFEMEANVDLLNGVLPGGIDLMSQVTLDPMSRHLGADLFVDLAPGCYQAVSAPARAFEGSGFLPSVDCAAAATTAQVLGGKTTEVLLVNQCVGDPSGALDTVVALNQPPSLEVIIPEKIGLECVEREVCVRASDPNDDPLWVDLQLDSGPDPFRITRGPTEVVGFEAGARIWETCFDVVTEEEGTNHFRAIARDKGLINGQPVFMEQITGNPSRDKLMFPIHTVWEEAVCVDELGDLEPLSGEPVLREAGCDWTDAQEWYCDEQNDPSLVPFVCDQSGNLIASALYPDCDGTVIPPGDDDDDDHYYPPKGDDDDDVTPPGDDDDDDHYYPPGDDDDDDVTPPGDDDDDDFDGRMTGGGVMRVGNIRATYGMNFRCDPEDQRFNLQINWGRGNRFHLESVSDIECFSTGEDPSPPVALFDTLEGEGFGRLNGVSGARAEWSFTDAGEPGRDDVTTLRIWDGQDLVLDITGNLRGGNNQAH